MKFKKYKKALIIHHWDTDGICSAALIVRYMKVQGYKGEVFNFVPEIGKYHLKDVEIEKFKGDEYDLIVITDLALPKIDVLNLNKATDADVIMFDHHETMPIEGIEQINPMVDGRNLSDFPSAGWVVNDYFGKPQEILAAIGAVGDKEDLAEPFVSKILKENNLNMRLARSIVSLIDSNFMMNKRASVREAVLAIEKMNDIGKVLENEEWKENLKILQSEIREEMEDGSMKILDKVIVKELKSSLRIIPKVTRKLSKKYPKKIVIVINRNDERIDNVYFRRREMNVDLGSVVELARSKGYNAGGKQEVAGVYVPKDKTDKFVKEALELIG